MSVLFSLIKREPKPKGTQEEKKEEGKKEETAAPQGSQVD